MAIISLKSLRSPITRAAAVDSVIGVLADLGFPTANWQSGSVPRAMVEIVALILERTGDAIDSLSRAVFLDSASGEYLTELAVSHYRVLRNPAVAAKFDLALLGGAAGPPHSVAEGELVATDGTFTYRNEAAVTVAANSTTTVTFIAEQPGSAASVAPSTISELQTPLAGVTITTGSNALDTAGQDAETDAALRERCRTKWATLTVETTTDGLISRIRDAVSGVTRVKIDDSNPRGAGTADVYLASSTGAAGGSDVTASVTAIQRAVFMSDTGETSSDSVYVRAASETTVTVTGTVYYESSAVQTTVSEGVDAAVAEYVNSAPIGGYDLSPGPSNVLLRNDIIAAIEGVDGVRSVVLTAPAADVSVATFDVARVTTPLSGLVYTAVTG